LQLLPVTFEAVTATPVEARAMSALLTVDLAAIRENYRRLAYRAAVPLIPMIKANAYGLGAVEVALTLESQSPLAFGVATVSEGVQLRTAGIARPILVFTPTLPHEFARARSAALTLALSDPAAIAQWTTLGGPWHLSVDTGMHRSGADYRDLDAIRDALGAGSPPDGMFTHFVASDTDDALTALQEARFESVLASLHAPPGVIHAENSGALLRRGRSRYGAARPGLALYGVSNTETQQALEPVVELSAPIVQLHDVRPGDTVSYSATWRAPALRRIATVALGYADGYPRGAGNAATALVANRRVPVVGLVTMDMTMCDVTDVPCAVGEPVTLIGGCDNESLAQLSRLSGRSPYEVLTGLHARAGRVHLASSGADTRGAAA
jgi:alanine racemase